MYTPESRVVTSGMTRLLVVTGPLSVVMVTPLRDPSKETILSRWYQKTCSGGSGLSGTTQVMLRGDP